MADFRRIFKSTKEERKNQNIFLLNKKIEFIKNEECNACKYFEAKKDYECGMHETTIGYCAKHKRYMPEHCNDWDI